MSNIENIFQVTFLNKESETPEEMRITYHATSVDVAKGLFIQQFQSRNWEFVSAQYLGQREKGSGEWGCASCGDI